MYNLRAPLDVHFNLISPKKLGISEAIRSVTELHDKKTEFRERVIVIPLILITA